MKTKRIVKEALSWIKHLVVALICALIINNTLVASALVVSSSMENTIMTDSRVMGLRVAYLINEPERFDIILFQPPDDITSIPYEIKLTGDYKFLRYGCGSQKSVIRNQAYLPCNVLVFEV